MSNNTVRWSNYEFTVYGPNTTWNDVAGLYIFAGLNANNQWVALYIGQTVSFQDRPGNHDRWDEAARLGATHVHAMVVPLQANRDAIEELLIGNHAPRLNTQHRR